MTSDGAAAASFRAGAAPRSAPAAPPESGIAPARAAGVELLGELSGSGYRRTPGLVRRGDAQTLQLTPVLYALLRAVDGQRDSDDIAAEMSARTGVRFEAADVTYLLDTKLRPLGVLQEHDGSTPAAAKANPLLVLRFKFVISNPTLTRRITAPFAVLFHPVLMVPALAAFAAVAYWLLFDKGLASATHQAIYEPGLLLAVVGLTMLSGAFHEFGHAAACRYGGATPGAMGGGLYIVWPAFYTDVDDCYRLSRGGRLRVDLGGLYFNVLFALATIGMWALTRSDALLLVIVTQLAQMARQLAPFIRADGYHIIADLIGVPDLFAHIKPMLLGLLSLSRGRRPRSDLKTWATVVVAGWVLAVVPTLVTMLVVGAMVLPRLAATAWSSGHLHWAALSVSAHRGDVADTTLQAVQLVALALPVLAVVYMLVRIARRTVRRVWSATRGRPRMRAASVVAGLGVVALLAWAWWPHGQYAPVTGHERGTLPAIVLPLPHLGVTQATPMAARPQAAVALVPRVPAGADPGRYATVLLVPTGHGSAVDTIVTPTSGGSSTSRGWVFPFAPPPTPKPGDNQAKAINTTDGSVVYDVSYALVWVTDDAPVLNHNEAWSMASCQDCATVSVAFQVILVIGSSGQMAPVNTAAAASYQCSTCVTRALAVQLIATLSAEPSAQAQQAIAKAWAQLPTATRDVVGMTTAQIYAGMVAVEQQIVDALSADGVLTGVDAATASSSPTPTASDNPAVAPAASATGDTATAGGAATDPTSTAAPVDPAFPTPSDSATPTPTPTDTSASPDASATPTDSATATPSP